MKLQNIIVKRVTVVNLVKFGVLVNNRGSDGIGCFRIKDGFNGVYAGYDIHESGEI